MIFSLYPHRCPCTVAPLTVSSNGVSPAGISRLSPPGGGTENQIRSTHRAPSLGAITSRIPMAILEARMIVLLIPLSGIDLISSGLSSIRVRQHRAGRRALVGRVVQQEDRSAACCAGGRRAGCRASGTRTAQGRRPRENASQ